MRNLLHGEKKRIYVAGPMTGYPHFNFPRFNAVAKVLRVYGHEVFNPAEADLETYGEKITNAAGDLAQAKKEGFSLRQTLNKDLQYICLTANALALLPGWEISNGTQAEWRTAIALRAANEGMEFFYLTEEECQWMERAQTLMTAAEEVEWA